jgi:hypothetical protein
VMTETQLDAASIRAVGPIYAAAILEELRLFDVMDRLVSLYQSGRLPIRRAPAGERLYQYWRRQPPRLSEAERRSLYSRVVGVGGGDADATANREFADLWLRFTAAVSALARPDVTATPVERAVRQQAVRQAGRELASNLSLHGYGFTHFAASELQTEVKTIISVLSDPDVRSAYGARSMWEVIDKVSSVELGGARNARRYRTMAESGSTIIAWLARKVRELGKDSTRPILGSQPDGRGLIAACAQWAAARGEPDDDPRPR